MQKNILIVSIYYPPIQSIASNRIYSFAKYLDKDKFNVFVHTLDEGEGLDDKLDGVSVSRVKNLSVLKYMTFDKRTSKWVHYLKLIYNKILRYIDKKKYQGWVDESLAFLPELIKSNNIDVLISSFAPAECHEVALQLKKSHPDLIWIADMRDEMSASPFINHKTKEDYQRLEKEIFKYGDAITSVSKPILDEFKSFAGGNNLVYEEIRNGYDFELPTSEIKNKRFTISYIGSFYGDRNPNMFLMALSQLVAEGAVSDLQVRFVGVKTHFYIPENLADYVSLIGTVPHSDAIKEMKNSDALLLIHPTNGRKGVYTGKLFEYLAALKPIIGLIDTGDVAAQLMRECNAGIAVDINDIAGIKKVTLATYEQWEAKGEYSMNIELIKKHHRKEQVKRLGLLIEGLTCG